MFARQLLSSLFPELIFRINTTEKILYLTFDDGPTENTPWVLAELKEYNAHATFFCIGCNAEINRDLLTETISQGHTVGNHTMNHLNGWKTSVDNYVNDVKSCDVVLNELRSEVGRQNSDFGLPTSNFQFFRPPHGRLTPTQYSALKENHRIVMWDVLSKDYDKNISAEKCLQRVITKAKSGSVIVFHDNVKAEKNLRYVLPRVMEYFSERNFSFCPMAN